MRIALGKTEIEVDVKATRLSYIRMTMPGPEECGCSYCRNWAAQRQTAYPSSVRSLFEEMGIRFGYETEVWDAPWDGGRRCCGGWYTFLGDIVTKSEDHVLFDDMELWLSEGVSYNVPWLEPGNGHEIHFYTTVDWVLDEPMEPEQRDARDG